MLAAALAVQPLSADAAEKPAERTGEAWPASVQARYHLRYNGINVGHLEVKSSTTSKTYNLSGSGQVTALFGMVKWSGSSNVSGVIDGGAPVPSSYALDWRNNKKGGTVRMGFKGRSAIDVAVDPRPDDHPDIVPLKQSHKSAAVDPVTAIMLLTMADNGPPCDRRVGIFDGKQRYDIVLTPKREIQLPSAAAGGASETGFVCRAMYEPIAGHRANAATKTYAANRDVEVVMRRIPGSGMVIPYSVSIPTFWGTGSLVTERIDLVSATGSRVALTK